ncbi:MAG: hypothetical protein QOD72_1390 [Acidimicrobiaceae bacterium]|jgi:sugar lactone lactonase YvrE|nr:hypothetical protein [Acidimicrobiaceae bacterium]
MKFRRKLMLAIALVAMAIPTAARADPMPGPTAGRLLASGLSGTIGGTVGPDGALYVPEGKLGKITRVDPKTGHATTFASGFPPSVVNIGGADIGGVIDVAFIRHTAYALVSLVGKFIDGSDAVNGIYRVDGPNSFTVIADIGQWSVDHPPSTQFDVPSGLQFALQPIDGGFLVSDGHHNRVLRVTLDGQISQVIQFDNVVPTGLATRGNKVYVSEVGHVPYEPEDGKVVSFDLRTRRPRTGTDVASGFSAIVDVEFGPHGELYALSQGDSIAADAPAATPAAPDSGKLLRVNKDGTFSVVVDKLDRPSSLNFVGDTALIVTLNGEVWKIKDVPKLRHGHHGQADD